MRVYLKEKGLEVPFETVNLVEGEQRSPAFLARNPLGGVPVLELDDGSHLSESLAIIEYLEELHPEPPMIGRDPLERARVRRLERIIDLGLLGRVARIIHATRSPLPGVEPKPEVARYFEAGLPELLRLLDAEVGTQPFAAGDQPSIADCTLFAAFEFARFGRIELDPACAHLHRWYAAFRERPSAQLP